jgi:hypothetical protein
MGKRVSGYPRFPLWTGMGNAFDDYIYRICHEFNVPIIMAY